MSYKSNLILSLNNEDYVSQLKHFADLRQQEVKYDFDAMPSPRELPRFRCVVKFMNYSLITEGIGKKNPKQEAARLLLLLLSGDVETNPGPEFNMCFVRETKMRMKIDKLAQSRQKQQEKKKTIRRNERRQRKEQRKNFSFQMNSIVEEAKSIAIGMNKPPTWRAAAYAGLNFVAPGVGTTTATVVEGGRILNTVDKIHETVNNLASSCAENIPQAFAAHSNLTNIATITLDTINQTVERIASQEGLLSRLEKMVSGLTSSISSTTLLITVLVVLICLTLDWKISAAVIVMVLCYFKWPTSVVEKIKSIVFGWKFQMEIPENIYATIGQILFTLLAFFGVSQIPAERFYDNILKRLDSIPKAFNGASKIWEAAGKTFDCVSDEFKIYFLGIRREDLSSESSIAKEVSNWVERVKFYLSVREKNLLAKEGEHVKEVEALFTQMYRWKHTTSLWKSLPIECQRIIASLTPQMNELYKFACRSTVHEGGPRKAPLGIFLSGDSGRGKSELLYPLSFSLLANRGLDLKNAKNEVYVRNYETEYWDSYVGQKIVLFDDAFQMVDSPGNPSPEFMEAIRLLNTAPAHIHCADLNDKGRFFSSEICLYTSNLSCNFKNFIKSVNCPEAAIRRLNVNAYRILTNPNYEKEITVNGQIVRRLDIQKVKNCAECLKLHEAKGLKFRMPFCPHVQMFQKYDMFTDEILQEDITYSALVQQLKQYDNDLCQNEASKLAMYEELINNPFFFEMVNDDDAVMFEDAQTEPTHGALDMSVPTDVVALQTLITYLTHLASLPNINEDQILADLAAHPQLFATYQRRLYCGIKNVDLSNNSLNVAMESAGIHYNHNASIYHSIRNLKFTWRNVYDGFCKYVSKIGQQLQYIWEHSGVTEIIGFVYLGIWMLAMTGLAYSCFKSRICPVCNETETMCVCVRWSPDGLLFQGELFEFESTSSSEVKLKVKQQPRFEAAASSGQPQLKNPRGFTVETNSSANPMPKTVNYKYEVKFAPEVTSSGAPNLNTTKPFNVEMYRDEGCKDLESALIRKSLYALHLEKTVLGNVIFVQGTTFLTNYHFVAMCEARYSPETKLYLSNFSGRLVEFTVGDLIKNHIKLYKNGLQVDAVLVPLSPKESRVHPHPNITRHFITVSDLANLTGKYNAQLNSYAGRTVDNMICNMRSVVDVQMHNNEETIVDGNFQLKVNRTWSYFGATSDGDCGGPLIINETHASRKLLGIHMCARPYDNGSQGMSQTITQEMLREGMKHVPFECQCFSEIELPINEIDMSMEQCGSVPMNAGLFVHGTTLKTTTSGGKTKITPSKLYGLIEPKTMPTQLKPVNGNDPMYKGLLKFGKEVPRLDTKMLSMCVNDVANNLDTNVSRRDVSVYKRKLTYEEAILGVPDDDFLAPINRSTSMGFPYTCDVKDLRGKRTAFGDEEWTLDTPLAKQIHNDVLSLESKCREGIQTGVYWADTLKDERRPIEKVLAGKTRVFCGGPVHFTILFRQYFLGFAAWLMHNRNANEISTGTNVYSGDWSDIVNKLASRGRDGNRINVAAGDFANFDGSLSSQILWYILDLINNWYDDGEENKRIRHTLWMHIVHAIHINGNIIYQATHSQPSGCPITAILNSIYNSVVIRMVYLICAVWEGERIGDYSYCSMEKFNQFVACVSYGDDNLIAISQHILEWFNQVEITKAFAQIGHEYTDECKSGKIVPIRDITEVGFLKRKFVWDPLANRYIAPLELGVVLEIFQWTKKGLASDSITDANIDVTLRELSLHGKETFDKYSSILKKACVEKSIPFRFYSHQEYKDKVLELSFVTESKRIQKFKLIKTNRKLSKNYVFCDYKTHTLQINDFESKILIPKLLLFCQYRNIKIVDCDLQTQQIFEEISALM